LSLGVEAAKLVPELREQSKVPQESEPATTKPAKWSKENRPSLDQYAEWYFQQFDQNQSIEKLRTHYDASIAIVLTTVETHPFFQELSETVDVALKGQNSPLMSTEGFKLQRKSFESALNKSYRSNILNNRQFPSAPPWGWLSHENWFEKMNDGVRGLIVCKYADGVQLIAEALTALATKHGLTSEFNTRATDEGYYAFHFYVRIPSEFLLIGWAKKPISALVEIQITTQLQDVLRQLTHPFYENRRVRASRDQEEWKWQLQSPQFKASYLGHTLHLLEGMIVEIKKEIGRVPEHDPSKERG